MPTKVTTESVEKAIFLGLAELKVKSELISREATFDELDVDSLDLVELAQVVEDEFGVELDEDDVEGLQTVGEVIDLVVAKGP